MFQEDTVNTNNLDEMCRRRWTRALKKV